MSRIIKKNKHIKGSELKFQTNIREANLFDIANGNTIWLDSTLKKVKSVMIAFEDFDGEVKDIPPGYQKAICHLISDIKMGQNF